MIATADGNYLISAAFSGAETAKEDFLLIKVDREGNELWRSRFGDPDLIDYGSQVAQTADGGFIVVGERTPDLFTWDVEITLVKIDGDGHLVWQQTKAAAHTMFAAVGEHPDGGYARKPDPRQARGPRVPGSA